ncbi:MAG: glycosyltransferase family 4 protein [Sporichthyaceae bacterium]|nr:glycosyltransferase family 4 protein [Sporichthyaceae bacterium]
MSDRGLGTYTHELAEGLAAAGVDVTVYATGRSETMMLPRRHRQLPVLGTVLAKQRALLSARRGDTAQVAAGAGPTGEYRPAPAAAVGRLRGAGWYQAARGAVLRWELAWHLKQGGYDAVWTEWPIMDGYGVDFWTACRRLGIRLVHTVHDVTPHEFRPDYERITRAVYRRCHLLVLHSDEALDQLTARFPEVADKAIVAPHGLYNTYPRRPAARADVRRELGVAPDEALVLCFGAVRPFKNYESVVRAFAGHRFPAAVLVVAGTEHGYPGLDPRDSLALTRRLASELGVASAVRLLPGPFDPVRTAEILESADVTMLPYLSGSGSGLLLLCMTFGKYVVATAIGGMAEHLQDYPPHTILAGTGPTEVAQGLTTALERLRSAAPPSPTRPHYLEWPWIARRVLGVLETGDLTPASRFPESEHRRADAH